MRRITSSWFAVGFTSTVLACGGAAAPPEGPAPAAEASPAPSFESESSASDEARAIEAYEEEVEPMDSEPEPDPNAPRDVTYKMAPDGLIVEFDDLEFLPKAKAVKVKGGWGVEITVQVKGMGTQARYLLNSDGAPLAFAGKIKRKDKEDKFGDQRGESEDVVIEPGDVKTYRRTWPDKGRPPLWWENELFLDVGLWGVGHSVETRRALKEFFSLRMVAGNKPQPVIQPPKSVR